ncbi:hypothetical protein TcasGA2_TC033269 [Tribolium castaneum]|uniref:Uncharacterized protein n=1 Tax=Tribolium castaneum TaxID=7070 RepID=A0A139WHM9_TRICA|nr:hypothetical protein TcasGA2_TC033269 [Tribolium castaneum]
MRMSPSLKEERRVGIDRDTLCYDNGPTWCVEPRRTLVGFLLLLLLLLLLLHRTPSEKPPRSCFLLTDGYLDRAKLNTRLGAELGKVCRKGHLEISETITDFDRTKSTKQLKQQQKV